MWNISMPYSIKRSKNTINEGQALCAYIAWWFSWRQNEFNMIWIQLISGINYQAFEEKKIQATFRIIN